MSPCRIFEGPGGTRGFICGPGLTDPVCCVPGCHALADYLCDYPVKKKTGDALSDADSTCDRRLCRQHANPVGPDLHYCNAHYRMHVAANPTPIAGTITPARNAGKEG